MKNGTLNAAAAGALAILCAACDQLLPARREVIAAPPVAVDTAAAKTADTVRPQRRRPAASATPKATDEEEAFNVLRRALRRLVSAEQGFYAENGAYTEDLDRLGYRAEAPAKVKFLWLTREGWAASATHPDLPGRDCVIFVGRVNAAPTSLKYVRTAREGVAACDVTPPPPRRSDAPAPVVSGAADTGSAFEGVSPFVQMRVDLRNMVKAQEAYHATQGTYARRIEPLALQYLWQRGYSVAILSADPNSWSARASHVAQPGKSCVIWYGPVRSRPVTDSLQRSSDRPGVPVCDG
jgi:hypothetical protein